MASKGNFFSKFISFILVLIIVSGVGFLGYSLLSGGGMNMSSMGSMTSGDTNNSSSKDTMNMNGSSNNGNSSTTNAQYSTEITTAVLQNKDSIEKNIAALNDSLKLMTLDPFGVEGNTQSGTNQAVQQNNGQNQAPANGTTTQGNTTVNVYTGAANQATSMQSMGTTYDTAKMEKLHTALYKVSVGMQLLDQLKGNLAYQLEQASMEVKDPSKYYYNQYQITMQNKDKLTQALTNINEASSLVNINPYISPNGAVYDKERMTQIHNSIYKLAEVVVDLNKINDNFGKQAIYLGNTTQSYLNNAQSMSNMNMNNTGTSFFGNINFTTVFNILAVVFIVVFVVSIVGYISKLLKSPKNNG